MLLAELVAAADEVAATRSRRAKVETLATLLARLRPEEVEPAVAFLAGESRQGRIGVGWATVAAVSLPPADVPSLTLVALDEALGALAAESGPGSGERRDRILRMLLGQATAREADFVRRLLVGELRHGALEGIVAEAVAVAAAVPAELLRRALMLRGDLGATAAVALTAGATGLSAVGLELGRPVLPMLAASADSVASALAQLGGEGRLEWKLDGIRVQVHRDERGVRVFTRNLNDITERVPEIVALARSLPVRRVVLDGEALLLDEAERPQLFQVTISHLGRRADPGAALRAAAGAPAAWFFDCLHLDGQDLIDRPLRERAAALQAIAGRYVIPAEVTADVAAAERFLRGALESGHEGVVVKDPGSPYQAGRRGGTWLKVKPVRSLDLVVLAAEWGHGRRRGWLSNLHLGARDPAGGFVMVGKTFKGLTDELLRWQTEQLLAREVSRSGIVVHVRPELVVEVALDGVLTSTRYPGGVALRFARVRRYREDKRPDETDTIAAVRALRAG